VKVVFFNRSYYPDFGATGQLLTELCEDLVARYGYDVTVVAGLPLAAEAPLAPLPWYAPVRREERNGVRILRAWGTALPNRKLAGRITNYLSYFSSASIAALRIGRPDIIVALTDPPIVALTAIAASRATRSRFVFLCQDVFPEVARLLEHVQGGAVEKLLARIGRFTVGRADAIVALGDTMKRRLIETKNAAPAKIRVIHNWADADAIAPGSKENAFAREHGLTDKFVVMHSGNVGHAQDLDSLVRAATFLRDLDDLAILIIGTGARHAELVALAELLEVDQVRFLYYQARDVLAESLSAADVHVVGLAPGLAGYVVPSRLYGILAVARPVIVAADAESETAQVVQRVGCGIVVPPGHPELLARAIRDAHDGKHDLAEMGRRGREWVEREADRSVAVRRYRELLGELAPS
jgi:putative colanic acid biosynthesis glycosyltransferase WcaI